MSQALQSLISELNSFAALQTALHCKIQDIRPMLSFRSCLGRIGAKEATLACAIASTMYRYKRSLTLYE